jgi:putative pyrroloquinoline-quinone binding quinoprotein
VARATVLAVIVATIGGLGPIPAHAAGGDTLWESRYAGPIRYDSAYSMAVSPDGARVFVTGYSSRDFATVAYAAATGAALWVSRYDSGVDFARSMAVSPDGARVFVTGTSYRGPGRSYDYVTVAYDAATGATLWVRRYNGPRSGDDEAYSVGVSPDGARVFVTGGSWGGFTTELDYATVGYDAATGATLWGRRYDGPGNGGDIAHVVAVSPKGPGSS